MDQQSSVVIKPSARHDARDIGAYRLDSKPCNEMSEVFGVRTDVGNGAGDATARRIGAPISLLLASRFEVASKPTLMIFDHDLPDLAQFPPTGHIACFTHHRIAGVVVGD